MKRSACLFLLFTCSLAYVPKFLESAYARVGILSNGDFKLYIMQQGLGGMNNPNAQGNYGLSYSQWGSSRGVCPSGYDYVSHPNNRLAALIGGKCVPDVNARIKARGSGISCGEGEGGNYTQHSSGKQPNMPRTADDFRAAGYIWQNGHGGRDARPDGWVRIESSNISHGGPDGRHKP